MQRDKLRIRAGKRAWKFEEKLKAGQGSNITRKCWLEIEDRDKRLEVGSEWEMERKKFRKRMGIGIGNVER